MLRKVLAGIVCLALCGAGAVGAARWEYGRPGPLAVPVILVLPKGAGTQAIAKQLEAAGVIRSATVFAITAKAQQAMRRPSLKAGEYAFAPHETPAEIVAELRAGRVVVHRLTVPEGFTNRQIAILLDEEPALTGDVGSLPPEGHLLPETYSFTRGDSRAGLVQRMRAASARAIDEAWSRRDIATPVRSREEALIVASLIEKETGVPEERAKVASVFYNRLKLGMKLQSDPTVIYAMSEGLGQIDRPLKHDDLGLESPYNTYLNAGLPPSPICNPGRAVLDAALHPANAPYLYFVATGHGGHTFASTIADHNRNVAQYVKTLHAQGP